MDCKEVENLLAAYALNALSADEEALVEEHLDTCPWCPALLREDAQVASVLAQATETVEPPPGLKASTMKAVERQRPRRSRPRQPALTGFRLALTAASSIAVLLVAAGIGTILYLSNQIGDLQQQNSNLSDQVTQLDGAIQRENLQLASQVTQLEAYLQQENVQLASQISQLTETDEKLLGMVKEQRSLTYVMASPDKLMLSLEGAEGASQPQGVLMVDAPAGTAILMTKGLEPSSEDMAYRVWLRKNGQPITVGSLSVDEHGWGVLPLWPQQPITLFQQVWVTLEPAEGGPTPTSRPVLWGSIMPR